MDRPSWQDAHYSFYCNRQCEYFPCHRTEDPDNFNCLFCYCPLYALGRECGGNFRYTPKGIKDCTGCLFPHRRENYPEVVRRFRKIVERMRSLEQKGNMKPDQRAEDGHKTRVCMDRTAPSPSGAQDTSKEAVREAP